MAILDFQKPNNVIMLQADDFKGLFEFRPLEPGYGVTIGNAIRRVLLSSLEGYAITRIKIAGVDHEFSTISGVREDVIDIVLNLKQVRFRPKNPEEEIKEETINLTISGQEQFKAGDLDNALINFEVLNKDLVICNLEPSKELNIEITVEKGRGYVPAENNEKNDSFGTIAIDSIFTPIKNVKYTVEPYRVGQKTDYEKLIIEITTDGSIHPKIALEEAAKILIYHFSLFSEKKITVETEKEPDDRGIDEEWIQRRRILKKRLVDLDLSVRALNCLKAADVHTLGDLVTYKKEDLLKFRNFGKKSLAEIEALLEQFNLEFGMDVSQYKLEEDDEERKDS